MTRSIERARTFSPLPEIDDVTRREFLIGAGGLLVLAPYGCGRANEEGGAAAGGTRTVEHALGATEVPKEPRRVVALDPFFTLQNAVALGVPVVGSTTLQGSEPWPSVLSEGETERLEGIGPYGQPDLEALAALEPDLILGIAEDAGNQENYDKFSQVAPTVLFGLADTYDWKRHIRLVAEATGTSEGAREGFGEYDARVGGIRPRLRDGTLSHALIAPFEGENTVSTYVQGPNAYGPFRVLEEVGVRRPPFEVVEDDRTAKEISVETLSKLEGDALFYNIGLADIGEREAEQAEGVLDSPLWRRLPAVRNGEAHRVSSQQWMAFGGLRSALLVLDDVEKHLTER